MDMISTMTIASFARTVGHSHFGSWMSATVKFISSSTEYVLPDDMIAFVQIIIE